MITLFYQHVVRLGRWFAALYSVAYSLTANEAASGIYKYNALFGAIVPGLINTI